MNVAWLSVEDFRNHRSTRIDFDSARTLIVGPNGHGKTNLLEAFALLSGSRSFRGANSEALVRAGCERAFVRAELHRRTAPDLVEMEIAASGRSRAQLNHQRVRSMRDLADVVAVVVFCPADLVIPGGGPSARRDLLDDVLSMSDREFRAVRSDFERVLRQRNNLLKQCGHRPDGDALRTLDVWDEQFARAGEVVAQRRSDLCAAIAPLVNGAYDKLSGNDDSLALTYVAPWREAGLAASLHSGRSNDLRRGTTADGPHRDDVEIRLDGLVARNHASQGEQRSIALALRLAQHSHAAAAAGTAPIVLLDDVFSELDDRRARRLIDCLPDAQTILTSASDAGLAGNMKIERINIFEGAVVK